MLISAQYLDRDALSNYIAVVEGGLRQSGSSRSKGASGLRGSLSVGPATAEATRGAETETTLDVADHDASRLQRLLDSGHENPEALGWWEVMDPDAEFPTIGLGAFVEWECDVYIPEVVTAMSNHAGMSETLKTVQALMPSAEALGFDMEGLPEIDQMQAMGSFLENLNVAPVVVGDDADTEWKVLGALDKRWIRGNATLDDRARIIGKVKKQVGHGKWYPLFSLPGMNLKSRDERRRMEREGPRNTEEEANFVRGPLLVVEYLAIYS